MTRKLALAHLKVAILRGDDKTATKLLIENSISRNTYNKMWQEYGRNVNVGYSQ